MSRLSEADAELNARIRDWAHSQGLPCAARGPIPHAIHAAFWNAHYARDTGKTDTSITGRTL
jgi:hypothetical protein